MGFLVIINHSIILLPSNKAPGGFSRGAYLQKKNSRLGAYSREQLVWRCGLIRGLTTLNLLELMSKLIVEA